VSIIHMAVSPTHTTMSSHSTTATDRHPTETRTTTNDNDVMAQRGSNYFFGFLITFIILFFIFVGCGIASRRRLLRARGENALVGDPWGMLRPNVEQKRPTFYDYPLAAPTKVDHWEKIMPLSATLLKGNSKTSLDETGDSPRSFSPPNSDLEAAADGHATPYRIFPGFSLHQWMARRRDPPEREKETYDSPEALNIAVVIAMPCSPKDRRRTLGYTDFVRLTERQFGTTIVPWHTEVSSTLVPVVLANPTPTPTPPPNL